MARTNNLTNYLTDVATAIKTKKGDSTPILASDFDTEIANLPSGGGGDSDYFQTTDIIPLTGSSSQKTPTSIRAYLGHYAMKKLPNLNLQVLSGNYGCQYALSNCPNLEEATINTIDFITNNVKTMFKGLFYGCTKLKKVDMSSLNITDPQNFSLVFKNCSALERVDIAGIKGVSDVGELFSGCTSLSYIDISGLDIANCSNVINQYGTFLDNVPTTCEIIVADQTQKDFMTTTFPSYTNVKTAAEYEAE